MNADVRDWLVEWFEKNTNLNEEEIKKRDEENYLEKGWIDSLKFIDFISDMEKKFNIRFSNNEFQNRDFSLLKGLTKIVEKKMKNRGRKR